ncbi:MAG: hypothetical protein Q8L23_15960 [Caulobacter sp.]|nr:hypothetical protein [Caulobacter sp.]
MTKPTLDRFDFQAQPDGSYDWCVTLSWAVSDPRKPGETTKVYEGPMPPARAMADYGVDLAAVVAGLNAAAFAQIAARDQALTQAQSAAEELEARVESLTGVETDLRRQLAAETANVARLCDALDAATAEAAGLKGELARCAERVLELEAGVAASTIETV